MTDNLDIWNKLSKTDPKHTKGFKRAGGFGGTAIKPIYTEQKMTEVFGPAGKGWGMGEPTFQTVQGNEGQIAVYCTVALWWNDPSAQSGPHMVYGVGGDMVVVKQSAGLRTDDEAFKKAFTDAVGNAMKHLGMSADVHMGLFDDSKYVREREAEEAGADRHTGEIAPAAHTEPADGLPVPAVGGLKNTAQRALWGRLVAATRAVTTLAEFNALWAHPASQAAYDGFSKDWKDELDAEKRDKAAELHERAPEGDPTVTLDRQFPGDTPLPKATRVAMTP